MRATSGMGVLFLSALLCTLSPAVAGACDSSLNTAGQMEWCSRDHGFNEGATCGLNALGGVLTGLPAPAQQPILGNAWDRTNMMGAAKVAFRAGYRDAAINAALYCQIHNPDYSRLQQCRDEVAAWLGR